MLITSRITPVAGSMISVEKLLDDVFAEAESFSTQGIPLKGRFPFAAFRDNPDPDLLRNLKGQIAGAWRQGWCEYHETTKSRGRPPVRAAYFILVEFSGIRIKTDCVHQFFTLLLTRTKSTQYGRFLIVANQSLENGAVSIVLHPVALDGRMIRLEKDFPREFHRRVETAFRSDPERVIGLWLSS